MIFPAQLRAARALLNISQLRLSEMSGVGIATIKRIELGDDISGTARTLMRLCTALEADGIVFIGQDEVGGPGVRLRDKLPMP